MANPLSDLGKINDSGLMLVGTVGRRFAHPYGVRFSVTHMALGRGGVPEILPWEHAPMTSEYADGPFGPETNLTVVGAGPSMELTPEGTDPAEIIWSVCGGLAFWDVGSSDLTLPFTDTDPAACLSMDALIALSERVALNTRLDGYFLLGDNSDRNPLRKEVVHGLGLGLRLWF